MSDACDVLASLFNKDLHPRKYTKRLRGTQDSMSSWMGIEVCFAADLVRDLRQFMYEMKPRACEIWGAKQDDQGPLLHCLWLFSQTVYFCSSGD